MQPSSLERVALPDIHIPPSPNTVNVRIIDTTASIRCPVDYFLSSNVGNLSELDCIAFSFLVENPRIGNKVLFDLGVRKDWENLPAPVVQRLLNQGFKINVRKGVSEILQDGGIKLTEINTIIWR